MQRCTCNVVIAPRLRRLLGSDRDSLALCPIYHSKAHRSEAARQLRRAACGMNCRRFSLARSLVIGRQCPAATSARRQLLVPSILLPARLGHMLLVPCRTPISRRDRRELATPPYRQAWMAPAYRRQVVRYHRKEAPGTILVDTAARYVYYVLPEGKAIRYGAIVGEDAQAWSGVAAVGRKEEWP